MLVISKHGQRVAVLEKGIKKIDVTPFSACYHDNSSPCHDFGNFPPPHFPPDLSDMAKYWDAAATFKKQTKSHQKYTDCPDQTNCSDLVPQVSCLH